MSLELAATGFKHMSGPHNTPGVMVRSRPLLREPSNAPRVCAASGFRTNPRTHPSLY